MGAACIWSYTWGGEFFGTSCATPMAVGHMAVLKSSNPKLRSSRLRRTLEASAVDAGEEGKDNSFGSGLLRLPKLKKK